MLSAASGWRLLSERRDDERRTSEQPRRRRGYHPSFESHRGENRPEKAASSISDFARIHYLFRAASEKREEKWERGRMRGENTRMRMSRARRLKSPRQIAACYQVASFYCFTADEGFILFLSLARISLARISPPFLALWQYQHIYILYSFLLLPLSLSLFLLTAAFSSYRETEAPRLI